jgi:3-hydroxyacyl-CoA dehydrogenase
MAKKVVLFGAGATGRGHVGLLAWQAGYELVLVDNKPALVETLRKAGQYTVRLFGGSKSTGGKAQPENAATQTAGFQEVTVSGFKVYHAMEREAIAGEIISADLVLTAVFDQNLPAKT